MPSPKTAFEWALQNGWIKAADESAWLEILSDRNLTSHTYRAAMGQQVSKSIIDGHVKHFNLLLGKMR